MEELRNYSQHEGIPVRWTKFSYSAKDTTNERNFEFLVEFGVAKSELKDSGFKKNNHDQMPDQIDLKISTRCYMESFNRIHTALRRLIMPQLNQAKEKFESAIESYQTIYIEEFSGIYTLCLNEKSIKKGSRKS